jgi:hypothetical protein
MFGCMVVDMGPVHMSSAYVMVCGDGMSVRQSAHQGRDHQKEQSTEETDNKEQGKRVSCD